MITEALQQVAGLFSRRFFFNALLPTFAFTTVSLVIGGVARGATPAWSALWFGMDVLGRLLLVMAYVALIYLLAAAVASQWRNIVRIFEGYPLVAVSNRFGRTPIGRSWHQAKQRKLLSPTDGRPDQAYYRYPSGLYQDSLLPTRLGNILLAGERYSRERYGIDAIYFWPRLYPLLPIEYQREYEESVIQYQFPLVVSFLSFVSTVACSVVLIAEGAPPLFFAAVFATGIALAYWSYSLSLMSAIEMAEIQRSAFDLYRGRLLLAWPSVSDVEDERVAFRRILAFVVHGAPATWSASHGRYVVRNRQPGDQGGSVSADPDVQKS